MELGIEKDLKGILRENGLNTQFWGDQFLKKGIQNCLQFKHADEDTIKDIKNGSQYGWEKNAIAACFLGVSDKKNDEKKEKQLTQTIQNVQKRMQELTDTIDETGRRERIAIGFNEAMTHKDLHKDLTKWNISGSELVKRENLPSLDVVRQISEGRILRGTFLHADMRTSVKPRRRLISIHQTDVDLTFPHKSEKYTSKEFFEQNQSQAFDHVIEHWGLSAAAGAGKGFGVLSIDAGFTNNQTDEFKHKNAALSAFTEIKDVVNVTTATFCIDDVKHSISDEAIEELKKLEKDDFPDYGQFFDEFGSHYFTGTYRFGGIYTKSVKCHSKEKMSESDTLKLVKNVQQGSVSGMFSDFSGSLTASHDHSKDEAFGQYKKEEDYTVEKELTIIGGPQEVDQISLWKFGLVKSNSTWAIIDQDNFETKWRGVWALLTDEHKEQFEDMKSIQRHLKTAWEHKNML